MGYTLNFDNLLYWLDNDINDNVLLRQLLEK